MCKQLSPDLLPNPSWFYLPHLTWHHVLLCCSSIWVSLNSFTVIVVNHFGLIFDWICHSTSTEWANHSSVSFLRSTSFICPGLRAKNMLVTCPVLGENRRLIFMTKHLVCNREHSCQQESDICGDSQQWCHVWRFLCKLIQLESLREDFSHVVILVMRFAVLLLCKGNKESRVDLSFVQHFQPFDLPPLKAKCVSPLGPMSFLWKCRVKACWSSAHRCMSWVCVQVCCHIASWFKYQLSLSCED